MFAEEKRNHGAVQLFNKAKFDYLSRKFPISQKFFVLWNQIKIDQNELLPTEAFQKFLFIFTFAFTFMRILRRRIEVWTDFI